MGHFKLQILVGSTIKNKGYPHTICRLVRREIISDENIFIIFSKRLGVIAVLIIANDLMKDLNGINNFI